MAHRRNDLRSAVLFVACFCTYAACHAQESSDLSFIGFWAEPLPNAVSSIERRSSGAHDPGADARPAYGVDEEGTQRRPAGREALSKAVEARLDALTEEEARNGERSPALIEQLTALGGLYQRLDEHDAAIAALQDAIQTIRINYGLYSLEQVGPVESVVESRLAAGEYGRAAGQRDYVRELVRRNPDDPRVAGVLSGLADSELDTARRLVDVQPPPEINIRISSGPQSHGLTPSPQRPALVALDSARDDYIAAINAAVRTRIGNPADLFALEDSLIDTVYFEFEHPELHGAAAMGPRARRDRSPLYAAGQRILQGKVINTVNFRRAPIEIAQALIELGDWYLLFSANGVALDKYRTAHDILSQQGVPSETIDRLLSPEIPAVLPVVREGFAHTGADGAYRGYIDMAIEINRYGSARNVKVLAMSSGTSKTVETRLRRYLVERRFRPRFIDGVLARSDRFNVRFYYDY